MKNQIEGRVAKIGETGNLITSISNDQLTAVPRDDSVTIKFGGHETIGIYQAEHDQPAATMVACLGNSGFLEIEIVGISLSEMLGIKPDVSIEVVW